MQYPEVIQTSLAYIERNLKTDITAEELARGAHYSTHHYYRLFSSVMGSSVAAYILKRRLDHALTEIARGRKAADVVPEYGFSTYAGFYKSFVKLYGCSPKKYLAIYRIHEPEQPEVATMYSITELRNILKHWDIDHNLPITDVLVMNGTRAAGNAWRIGNQYILKTGKREQLLKNIKVSKALQKYGLNASVPVLTIEGSDFTSVQEPFVLLHALKGKPLPTADRFGSESKRYAEQYGRGIARLHKALAAVQADILPDATNVFQVVSEWALPNVRQQNLQWTMGIDDGFFSDYLQTFGKLYPRLPKQLIHRDPNPSNVLFDNGSVSGWIDFDLSETSLRLWDVCYCATGVLVEGGVEAYEKWPSVLGGILHGYDAENAFVPEEKQAVFYVICSIQMICIAFFESRDEFKELAKINRRMLQYIIENQEAIRSAF